MARALGTLFSLVCVGCVATAHAADADSKDRQEFEKFIAQFGKAYSEMEKESRFETFRKNSRYIEEHNAAAGHSFTLALNELSDLSSSEFGRKMGFNASQESSGADAALEDPWAGMSLLGTMAAVGSALDAPTSVDWRGSACMTPVLDQGKCGGCWSFSATAAISAAWELATGTLPIISQQQLMDCSSSLGNQGCDGGNMALAFIYAKTAPLCTAASYPYQAAVGQCHQDCTQALPAGAIRGYRKVTANDEEALKVAVQQQPVSVGIEAEQTLAFQMYKSGVLSGDVCGTRPNHGVLLVGYGTSEEGGDYWLVKNSWGPTWGEDGYFKLARGAGPAGTGLCGILSMPSYPVVAVSPSQPGPTPAPALAPVPGPTPAPAPGQAPSPSGYYEKPPCREGEDVYTVATVQGSTAVCVPPCHSQGDACPDGGQCNLSDSSWMGFMFDKRFCSLPCTTSSSCPGEKVCVSSGGGSSSGAGTCMHLLQSSKTMRAPQGADGPGRRLRQESSPPSIFA